MVTMLYRYGNLRAGNKYELIQDGLDWFLLKARGKSIYVPKFLCSY